MRHDQRPSVIAILIISAWFTGCGEDWRAPTHPATGRVSVNGQAPVGAIVQLIPAAAPVDERNSRPWGLVKEDGTFALGTYETEGGAPAGQYAITLTWPIDPSVPSLTDRLGFRYSRPEQSRWRVTIKEGDNELPPIELADRAVDMANRPSSKARLRTPPMPGVIPASGKKGR